MGIQQAAREAMIISMVNVFLNDWFAVPKRVGFPGRNENRQ
jgi:hypothetical protein